MKSAPLMPGIRLSVTTRSKDSADLPTRSQPTRPSQAFTTSYPSSYASAPAARIVPARRLLPRSGRHSVSPGQRRSNHRTSGGALQARTFAGFSVVTTWLEDGDSQIMTSAPGDCQRGVGHWVVWARLCLTIRRTPWCQRSALRTRSNDSPTRTIHNRGPG